MSVGGAGRRGYRGGGVAEPVDYAAVWSAATDLLNDEIVSSQRRAYLRLTTLRAIADATALLGAREAVPRDVIESQLRTAITEALCRHLGRPIQVAVTVRPPDEAPRPDALTAPTAVVAMVPVRKRPSRAMDTHHENPNGSEPSEGLISGP